MTRFSQIALSGLLLAVVESTAIAQSRTIAGTITTYAGIGSGANATGPGCNRFNPCDTGGGYNGDAAPAISAKLFDPSGVAVDGNGNVFIADTNNNRIRKVTSDGVIWTVAGNGRTGFSGDGGLATSAMLNQPQAIALDSTGNLFIADRANDRIRKVTPDGLISTVAGNGAGGYGGDGGPATAAQIYRPLGVAVDAEGDVFIADTWNRRVRKVNPIGIISTVAGNGSNGFSGDGGPATAATLSGPWHVAVDAIGDLFIVDSNNRRIRKVTPDGIISTVAGNGASGYTGDGDPATSTALNTPEGVAVDTAGNLFIADSSNHRIRKVTPDGVISTIAGNGTLGVSGDGGPAISAAFGYPSGITLSAAGDLFIADTQNHRIRKVAFAEMEFLSYAKGVSVSTRDDSPATSTGYAAIFPAAGSAAPSGLAIIGFRENNVLISEASVPASPPLQSGRIYAEVNGSVNTGLALVNPNSQSATVSFFFSDSNGNNFGDGVTTIPAKGKIAAFLSENPFNGASVLSGSFTFNSSIPIAAVAIRGLINERSEFLMTTLPVIDLRRSSSGPVIFPHFADGGGWTTQIALVNPGDTVLTGTVQFLDQQGTPAMVTMNGARNKSFPYSIPPRTSQKLETTGAGTSLLSGSIRVAPDSTTTPVGLGIFSFRNNGITVTQAGVPSSPAGTAFRLYAEAVGDPTASLSTQTGFAIANVSSDSATIVLELDNLDGSATGLTGTVSIPAEGQLAAFLNQIPEFSQIPNPFQGILRVSSISSLAVIGLRARYNQRNDFLITTTPPTNEAASASGDPLFVPHIVDSGGYTTQFILFSGAPGPTPSGILELFSPSGGPANINLH